MRSSAFSASGIRRNAAHCSKVVLSIPTACMIAVRDGNGPWAVRLGDQFARQLVVQAGYVAQQRFSGRIDVDSDFVDAILDGLQQAAVQFLLIHVVLVLADTDQFRIDFHEFRKRILQPAGEADGAARRSAPVGKFLARKTG